jgi:hypothetical protein
MHIEEGRFQLQKVDEWSCCGCINKECTEALQKPTPNTRANAAALLLITTSVPEDWEPEGSAKHVAFDTLTWVCNRFQGGHDRSINKGWLNQLHNDKMTREETFEQYVTKKYSLYENLIGNNHSLSMRTSQIL